jgi:hypothetical protein
LLALGVERVYAGGASVGVALLVVLGFGCVGGEGSRDGLVSLLPPQTCALDFSSSFDMTPLRTTDILKKQSVGPGSRSWSIDEHLQSSI